MPSLPGALLGPVNQGSSSTQEELITDSGEQIVTDSGEIILAR